MKREYRTRSLRERPDLNQLKRQAKELHRGFLTGDAAAIDEVQAHYRGADRESFALHDAQLVLARSYGFDSWPKLKAYVDGITIQRLVEFVKRDDLLQVQAMLRKRPELANMQMSYGDEHRAIHFAVMNRSREVTRLLMQQGADARSGIHPHREATAALTLAEERGYEEIVHVILEEEQHRREKMSPAAVTSAQDELSAAICRRDETRARELLEGDSARVHACDRDGLTPLHLAAAVRNPELVAWLLQRGADPNRRDPKGRTPLDLAAHARREFEPAKFAAVAALLRNAGAELTARSAAALGELDWLRARHTEGTLINPVEWYAGGLLTIAVRHNRPDVLHLLLDIGFDPNERARMEGSDGEYYSQADPLWQAAALGRFEMAETLLRHGADPNLHVDSSGSSVYSAYSHRQWEMAELLRRHGGIVTPDIVGIYRLRDLARELLAGNAAAEGAAELLHHGASGGDPEIVRMALEHIDWKRDDGRWFRVAAQPLSFWNHIPWLYAGNREFDRSTYLDCFRLVLQRCDPNLVTSFGRTLLHEVACMGDHITEDEAAPFASALIDAGGRTDARDDILKSTPLGWACRWGRASVARVLLERGADPAEAESETWARPAAWAEKMGHTDMLALVRSYGA